jgi:hypothetical protein
MSGAITMNSSVGKSFAVLSTPHPACATPAPDRPPINACEDDDGRPSHHVTRFHAIAPTSPQTTTSRNHVSCTSIVTMLAIVFATPM